VLVHGVREVFLVLPISNHFECEQICNQADRAQYGANVNFQNVLKPFYHENKALYTIYGDSFESSQIAFLKSLTKITRQKLFVEILFALLTFQQSLIDKKVSILRFDIDVRIEL
jgi:hypothetical protein